MRSHFCKLAKSQLAENVKIIGSLQFTRRRISGSNADPQNPESSEVKATIPSPKSKGGFAEAMAKFEGHENFTKMLRKSAFVQMGDPQGKIVEGKIIHVVNDDLYIDFGSKFNCVCPRPSKNGASYALGKKVRLLVHDLELSTRFLGAATDLTILEADCTLLGLASKPKQEQESDSHSSNPVAAE